MNFHKIWVEDSLMKKHSWNVYRIDPRLLFFCNPPFFASNGFHKIPFCLGGWFSKVLEESGLRSAFASRACQFVQQMDFLCVSSFRFILFLASGFPRHLIFRLDQWFSTYGTRDLFKRNVKIQLPSLNSITLEFGPT